MDHNLFELHSECITPSSCQSTHVACKIRYFPDLKMNRQPGFFFGNPKVERKWHGILNLVQAAKCIMEGEDTRPRHLCMTGEV